MIHAGREVPRDRIQLSKPVCNPTCSIKPLCRRRHNTRRIQSVLRCPAKEASVLGLHSLPNTNESPRRARAMEHVLKHGVRSAHSASCAQGKKHPELLSTRDPSFTNDITLIQSWAENRSQKRRGTVGRLHDNAHAVGTASQPGGNAH